MQTDFDIADTYYGNRENLLDLIYRKLVFYLPFLRVFTFLKLDGLHPGNLRNAPHIVDFIDQVAEHCLSTYDPQEPANSALERCIVDTLHRNCSGVDGVDPSKLLETECV